MIVIEKLKEDIKKYGENTVVDAYFDKDGLCTGYGVGYNTPVSDYKTVTKMTMNTLLFVLRKQNR